LGIIPFNTDINGNAEWCQPRDGDGNPQPGATPEDRYAALNHAVDVLGSLPEVSVYLDGTHSAWLGVGDISDRLVKAGVERADGFYVNASNYQATERLEKYGEWISGCIAFANNEEEGGWRLGHYDYCASQYFPADPNDFSTWVLSDEWYASNLGTAEPTTHFVIDTSRNGQGPWTPPADRPDGDPQDWCNPPDRGLGLRPGRDTGNELIDAFLWIKIPGESDGECTRWGPGPEDPVRGMVDPPAGVWFPEMALELVTNANPPLVR
jgi:endoglucanase